MFKNVLSAFFVLCSSVALAADYSDEGEITGMYAGENNIVGIFHSAPIKNPANCSFTQAYVLDYDSASDWNKVHSMLLVSYISKTPIRIAVDTSRCYYT